MSSSADQFHFTEGPNQVLHSQKVMLLIIHVEFSPSMLVVVTRRTPTGCKLVPPFVPTGSHVTRSHVTGIHVTRSPGIHVTRSHVTGSHVARSHITGSHVARSHVTGSHMTGIHSQSFFAHLNMFLMLCVFSFQVRSEETRCPKLYLLNKENLLTV